MPFDSMEGAGFIEIRGARVNNLKNISLKIPRDKFIVITGVSGSGKSSLAFDTIYAEGQRRYVESLSSYARQFLGRMDKPEVDFIHGIPPAIAIEQKVNTRNPRSTVGTSTEIYDYIKLLYARIGRTYSPVSGKEVIRHTVTDVIYSIEKKEPGEKLLILSPLSIPENQSLEEYLSELVKEGYTRIETGNEVFRIEDFITTVDTGNYKDPIYIVIDRVKASKDEDVLSRVADSVQSAFQLGKGYCTVRSIDKNSRESYSNLFEADGIEFEEPTEHMFSFNNPFGACPLCEGYGKIIGIDEDLVIPDKRLSVYEEAIVCWRGEKMRAWKDKLISNADKFGFPVHRPYNKLSDEQRELLWQGNRYFKGLNQFFAHLEGKKYKIQYRVMLARYRGKTTCPECKGARLKKEASHVKINKKSVQQLVLMSVDKLSVFFDNLQLSTREKGIAGRIITEIQNRINFLRDVGLGYLTLNRLSSTLSGGESQRINLATSLGSSLVGSLYILDEPSIGLHPRDTNRLIKVLRNLTGIQNTVIVVEHDEEIIRESDYLIDIGPEAGRLGGEVVFEGTIEEIFNKATLTSAYLTGREKIKIPDYRRKWNDYIEITGARQNNLKDISVKFPLNCLTVVSGVSGSGKSTLVCDILFPALNRIVNSTGDQAGAHDEIRGDTGAIEGVEFVNQNPIGRSSRSNPVTYIKAYDEIRKLFSLVPVSKNQGFKPSHFSFNVDGGRCEECQGEGTIKVEMQFMADVYLECENCKGRKFKEEILEATYNGKNIHDVLEMTVNEAIVFFSQKKGNLEKKINEKLSTLQSVGLGYVKLGQSSNTLSGGESQRVKLASFLGKETGSNSRRLFIFDEPTTGLHFHDISKLLNSFNALIERGHSVIVIEHNMEVIKSADWLIDLGPEGGEDGGTLVFAGEPEDLVKVNESHTGKYLLAKIGKLPTNN